MDMEMKKKRMKDILNNGRQEKKGKATQEVLWTH
jgi:hypothetical protein